MARSSTRLLPICLALAVALGASSAPAQTAPPQPDYHPSFGDLMTMAVQPRHTKLGLSGQARNWTYAAYEASELRNAFIRIGRTIPDYRTVNLTTMFAGSVTGPLDQVDAAIKAGDGKAFDAAYATLTTACNACHVALDHAYVVVKAPAATDFPDQVFASQPPVRK